ncbi:MAG: hypothetical protein ABIO82_05400 [Ginsengibacter sp.]
MKSFYININYACKQYRYYVVQVEASSDNETYKVITRNKAVFFTNNRPRLQEKKVRHWHMTWTMQGTEPNVVFQQLVLEALQKEI